MSSLCHIAWHQKLALTSDSSRIVVPAYRLLLVALEICSSKADPADDDHQPIMLVAWCDAPDADYSQSRLSGGLRCCRRGSSTCYAAGKWVIENGSVDW